MICKIIQSLNIDFNIAGNKLMLENVPEYNIESLFFKTQVKNENANQIETMKLERIRANVKHADIVVKIIKLLSL